MSRHKLQSSKVKCEPESIWKKLQFHQWSMSDVMSMSYHSQTPTTGTHFPPLTRIMKSRTICLNLKFSCEVKARVFLFLILPAFTLLFCQRLCHVMLLFTHSFIFLLKSSFQIHVCSSRGCKECFCLECF